MPIALGRLVVLGEVATFDLSALGRDFEDVEPELRRRDDSRRTCRPRVRRRHLEAGRLGRDRERVDDRHAVVGLSHAELLQLLDDPGRPSRWPDPPRRPFAHVGDRAHVGEQLLDLTLRDVGSAHRSERRRLHDADAAVVVARHHTVVGDVDEPVRALRKLPQLGRERHALSVRRGLTAVRPRSDARLTHETVTNRYENVP